MYHNQDATPVYVYSEELLVNMIMESCDYDTTLARDIHQLLVTVGGSGVFVGLIEFFKYAVDGFYHLSNNEYYRQDSLDGNLIVLNNEVREVYSYTFEIHRNTIFNSQYTLASNVEHDRSSSIIAEIYFNYGEDIGYIFKALDRLLRTFIESCIPSILHPVHYQGLTTLVRFATTGDILLVSNIKHNKE